MAKNFVFPDGTGVAAEMRRAPAFGKVNIGKLIVDTPIKERRNIVAVPLSAIVRNSPFQTRRAFDPDTNPKDRALVESIDALGQHEPVCLKLIAEGDYEIVWGHRRIAALRYLKRSTVLAIIFRGDLPETATWTALENTGEPLSPIEKAELADLLEKELRYSLDAIAVRLGCTKRELHRFKKILAADERVRFALQAETITLRLALALAAAPRACQPRLVEIALHNRGVLNDSVCTELVQHMADGPCSPDSAAAVFGLRLPIDNLVAPVEAAWDDRESERLCIGEDSKVDPVGGPEPGGASVTARDDQCVGQAGTPGNGPIEGATPTSLNHSKIVLARDAVAVAKMIQSEQTIVEPALLREVIHQGVGRGLSTRELRLASLLSHSQPPMNALEDAAALKNDRSARLVAEISERLGRLRDLAHRGGCSGQTAPLLLALAKEIEALAVEIKGPDKGSE